MYETSISVSKHVYVSTKQNVIACISTRTGLIVWRKILDAQEGKVIYVDIALNILLPYLLLRSACCNIALSFYVMYHYSSSATKIL